MCAGAHPDVALIWESAALPEPVRHCHSTGRRIDLEASHGPKGDLRGVFAPLILWQEPTQAHDIYTHLKSRSGESCCDNSDCRPVPYRVTASGVEMLVGET